MMMVRCYVLMSLLIVCSLVLLCAVCSCGVFVVGVRCLAVCVVYGLWFVRRLFLVVCCCLLFVASGAMFVVGCMLVEVRLVHDWCCVCVVYGVAVRCALSVVCCALLALCGWPCVVCCLLFVVCSLFVSVVCCLPLADICCCVLCDCCCSLFVVRRIVIVRCFVLLVYVSFVVVGVRC